MGESFLGFQKNTKTIGTTTSGVINNAIHFLPVVSPISVKENDSKALDVEKILRDDFSVAGSVDSDGIPIMGHNQLLSAYFGYRIATDYVHRSGGYKYSMTGNLISRSILPYSRNGSTVSKQGIYTIGSEHEQFLAVWANTFHGVLNGNAATASKLTPGASITVRLKKTDNQSLDSGTQKFDGSKNIDIVVNAPFLHLSGGTLSGSLTTNGSLTVKESTTLQGNVTINGQGAKVNIENGIPVTIGNNLTVKGDVSIAGTTYTHNIVPAGPGMTLGSPTNKFELIHTNKITVNTLDVAPAPDGTTGKLNGTATFAESLLNSRAICVSVNAAHETDGSPGYQFFNGSNNITICTPAVGYLKLTGGTITGNLQVNGEIHSGTVVTSGNFHTSIGHTLYVDQFAPAQNVWTENVNGSLVERRSDRSSYINFYNVRTASNRNIQAWIDNLASNAIVASTVLNPTNADGSYNTSNNKGSDLNLYANRVNIFKLGVSTTNSSKNAQIAEYDDGKTTSGYGTLYCDRIYCAQLSPMDSVNDDYANFIYLTNIGSAAGDDIINIYSGLDVWGGATFGDKLQVGEDGAPANCKVTGKLTVGGNVSCAGTCNKSDIRYKENITPINRKESVNLMSKMTPTIYDININNGSPTRARGFIAQQVKEESIKLEQRNSIYITDTDDEDTNISNSMSLSYEQFIPDLVNTCQYLLAKLDNLEVLVGLKEKLEFPELQHEATFDETYYREHAQEIAEM